ncbi:protein kinase [Zoogloea sp.]|uniref:protein kinase domain-containing protein n=2 Tax=Zoogloea sp. TaxID=49181 RepID=UPI0035AF0FB7
MSGVANVDQAARAVALPAGTQLQEYRIERILGSGGFGITYLAHDTHLDCPVAIKEFLPRDLASRGADASLVLASDEAQRSFEWGLQRFLLESRALAGFHHPGIVRVLRYFRANKTAYMVMAYETGQPLQQWLVGRLPLDRASLLRIVTPLLDGLEVIHKAGFLHRDIKPGNIYMRSDGSPVLLDFGSARRMHDDQADAGALTAVVSPGFAPVEQYHRHGHQGPWTDLYALAGVMYWMVTGRLPLDAFARVKNDPMPSALAVANQESFGTALLKAIDWALSPEEARRPRQVAEFRRACLAPPTGGEGGDAPVEAPLPIGISASEARTFIGAVLFAGLSGEAAEGHRPQLLQILKHAIAQVPPSNRLAVNTREGCAVCYVGDPEDALRTAVQLGDAAASAGLGVHMGINLGPVQVAPDPKGRSRILGDGITTAFRVMRFAEPGQVLVARAYYEVIQQLRRHGGPGFLPLGVRRDAQAREHELYAYSGEMPAASAGVQDVSLVRPALGADIAEGMVEAAERLLTLHIGPMARILVRRTLPQVQGPVDLFVRLAGLIPDAAPREAFLSSVTQLTGVSRSLTTQTLQRSQRVDFSRPAAPTTRVAFYLDDERQRRVEQVYARHIGPMARVLIRKTLPGAVDAQGFCSALAAHLDQESARHQLLAELSQALAPD